jgi:murein DD-endopeptidase MepM/ murein hydrolase activator NlpD
MTQYQLPLADSQMNYGFKAGVHNGFDMIRRTPMNPATPTLGSPLLAVCDGTVIASGFGVVMGYDYGNWIEYQADDGVFWFQAHARNRYGQGAGVKVTRGQQINQVGATGDVTGPHVHTAAMTKHLNKPTSFDGYAYINARLAPSTEDDSMSFALVQDAQTGGTRVVSLISGNYATVQSTYHLGLLQRVKVNMGGDPMLVGELDIVKGYLAAINPALTVATPVIPPISVSSDDIKTGVEAAFEGALISSTGKVAFPV